MGVRTLTRLCNFSYRPSPLGKRTLASMAGLCPPACIGFCADRTDTGYTSNSCSFGANFGTTFDYTESESSVENSTRNADIIGLGLILDDGDDGG